MHKDDKTIVEEKQDVEGNEERQDEFIEDVEKNENEDVEVLDEKDIKINELKETINKLTSEIETIKKAAADVINRSKNLELDRKYASSDLVKKLLVPLSYFEGALNIKTDDKNLSNFLKGFEMVYNLIFDQLYSEGLKEIKVNVGESYNPHIHDVSEVIPVNEDEEDEIILEVVQKGYYYKDRVIKPVKVKVSKHKEENNKEE